MAGILPHVELRVNGHLCVKHQLIDRRCALACNIKSFSEGRLSAFSYHYLRTGVMFRVSLGKRINLFDSCVEKSSLVAVFLQFVKISLSSFKICWIS